MVLRQREPSRPGDSLPFWEETCSRWWSSRPRCQTQPAPKRGPRPAGTLPVESCVGRGFISLSTIFWYNARRLKGSTVKGRVPVSMAYMFTPLERETPQREPTPARPRDASVLPLSRTLQSGRHPRRSQGERPGRGRGWGGVGTVGGEERGLQPPRAAPGRRATPPPSARRPRPKSSGNTGRLVVTRAHCPSVGYEAERGQGGTWVGHTSGSQHGSAR